MICRRSQAESRQSPITAVSILQDDAQEQGKTSSGLLQEHTESDTTADKALKPPVPKISVASPQRVLKARRRSLESRPQPDALLQSVGSLTEQLGSIQLPTPPRSPDSFHQLPPASCSFADVAAAADERRLAFGCCSWPHDAAILEPVAQLQPHWPLGIAPIEVSGGRQEETASASCAACTATTAVKIVPRVESGDGLDDCKPSSFFTVLPTVLDDIAES